ncbi:NUDIX domain-containing protein [Pontibacillus salicampi]|uniref:NUDIX domain-containing protein n=1 Tax=Pontibacillus salicampi TaxID=1449801 RepID=A0ABV6LT20_9BACI
MEILNVFNKDYEKIGTASREEVHTKGYWHETFQCWIVGMEENPYIVLQKRSHTKKEFPDLLDISAAGHLTAGETMEDGVRELEEELGVTVHYSQLYSCGVYKDGITIGSMKDNELANIFLYKLAGNIQSFQLQQEEVAAIVKADLHDFIALWRGDKQRIVVQGYTERLDRTRAAVTWQVSKSHFVPHGSHYYLYVAEQAKEYLHQ